MIIDSELAKITAQVDLKRYRMDLRVCKEGESKFEFFKQRNADEKLLDYMSKKIEVYKLRMSDTKEIVFGYFHFDDEVKVSLDKKLSFYLNGSGGLSEDDFIEAVAKRGYIIKSDFKFKTL